MSTGITGNIGEGFQNLSYVKRSGGFLILVDLRGGSVVVGDVGGVTNEGDSGDSG